MKKSFWWWLTTLLSGQPHEAIGGWENPYMLRWLLFFKNHFFNLFLHKFVRDDDDRARHCHPWWFISFVVWGSYFDHSETGVTWRRFGSIVFRRATYKHIVTLPRDLNGKPKPCWTIVLTGAKCRKWGFWCPGNRFVPWDQFTDPDDDTKIGKGCGE